MKWHITRKNGQVYTKYNDEEVAIKLVLPRPLSAKNKEIAIISTDGKTLGIIDTITHLDTDSQKIVEEELKNRYFIATITKILSIEAIFGNYHWHVQTNKGERKFILKNVNRNLIFVEDGAIIVHDSAGNYYEILHASHLDRTSRKQITKITGN